ncbi:hypothetical protein [Bacillus mojavensis]|uniref:hypothetical protein n=2 Tax=Bacillus subtilis group TaxID=653685 RepID=UPI002DB9F275|nr:hypothetical protein [Bacillus mojavensis]MEC1621106.1 hypothetical protein [Bacillus mojavensis]
MKEVEAMSKKRGMEILGLAIAFCVVFTFGLYILFKPGLNKEDFEAIMYSSGIPVGLFSLMLSILILDK